MMLSRLARSSSRASATVARVQRRSLTLHSPFAVLSSQPGSKPTAQRVVSEASKPAAAAVQSSQTEKKELDEASSEPANPRVYVVSHPDPALGAPHGIQLGAYPASEPFAN